MIITHHPLNFSPRRESGNRINNNNIDTARTHKSLSNFQRLFSIIWLRNKQVINIDPYFLCILHVKSMLSIDEGSTSSATLSFGNVMERKSCFTRRFRTKNLNDTAIGNSPTKGNIKRE